MLKPSHDHRHTAKSGSAIKAEPAMFGLGLVPTTYAEGILGHAMAAQQTQNTSLDATIWRGNSALLCTPDSQ